jgi:hypothetical protein
LKRNQDLNNSGSSGQWFESLANYSPQHLLPAGPFPGVTGTGRRHQKTASLTFSSSSHRLNLQLAGDFIADGKTDLVTELQDGYPYVLLSNGNGTFALYRF